MSCSLKFYAVICALAALISCTRKEENIDDLNRDISIVNEEECSIKLGGIHFTRSINGAVHNSNSNGAVITMRSSAKTDYFNEPDGSANVSSAPLLLSKIQKSKPFTFTAKVTPSFRATYDAGALYLFSNNNLWQKFAFEMDERGKTRVVSVRTVETSDDNNHEVITDKNYVYLKISSDTNSIGFYYSIDGETWNLARVYKNNYAETIWLGISAQSPLGSGNSVTFENCVLIDEAVKNFRTGL